MAEPAPQRILVVKLADTGDVLTATPALRALRQTFPQARLDVLLTESSAPVLQGSPLADELLFFDKFIYDRSQEALRPANLGRALKLARQLRSRRYDTAIILHHLTTRWGALKYAALALTCGAGRRVGLDNGRGFFLSHRAPDGGFGTRHEVEYWLDVVATLGATTADTRLEITTAEEDETFAAQLTNQPANNQPLVIVHPGSGGFSLARRWQPSGFAAVADALVGRRGARVILVGSAADGVEQVLAAMRSEPLNLAGRTTLGQLAALLRRCDLFIGADSGIVHLAAAVGAPLVAIFGPSNHRAWGPWSAGPVVVLRSGALCSPCSYVEGSVGQREGCPARTCMRSLKPETVLEAAERLLEMGSSTGTGPGRSAQPCTPTDTRPQRLHILGLGVDRLTYDDALARVESFIATGGPHQVITLNPEFVVLSRRDFIFRQIINRAALVIPDGVGLLWAARWLGRPLPGRVAGVDLVEKLAALSARRGYRLYFLGAAPGVAERAIAVLQARYPGMVAVGAYAGSPDPQEEDEIVERIRQARPDILLVAYGAPRQDKWLARNLPRLGAPVGIGVGGAFDFISGTAVRAPLWMQQLGLEWLHRLWHEPWRWRRMLALPHFILLVLLGGKRPPGLPRNKVPR
jgi:lipopolysaccharide heptosyltransferase II